MICFQQLSGVSLAPRRRALRQLSNQMEIEMRTLIIKEIEHVSGGSAVFVGNPIYQVGTASESPLPPLKVIPPGPPVISPGIVSPILP